MTIDDKLTYIKGCCFDINACRECKLTVGTTCPTKLWGEWTPEEIETAYAILHGEEKEITIEEMHDEIRAYCNKFPRCLGCRLCDSEGACRWYATIENEEDCYWFLVNEGLIGAPKQPKVNFVKADPDDEVKQADDVDRYEVHRKICDKLNDTYRKKNADYGNSFGNGFEEYGLIMPAIRLEDKFMRFKRLALGGKQNVTSESIKDTLLDLANYAIMTLVEMEENNDRDC